MSDGRAVEQAAVGQLDGGLGPADELGVERRERTARAGRGAGRAGPRCRRGTRRRRRGRRGRAKTQREDLAHRARPAQEAVPAPRAAPGRRGRAALDDRLVDRQDLVGDDRPVEEPARCWPARRELGPRAGSSQQVDERARRGRRGPRWRTSRPPTRRRAPARTPAGRWRARRRPALIASMRMMPKLSPPVFGRDVDVDRREQRGLVLVADRAEELARRRRPRAASPRVTSSASPGPATRTRSPGPRASTSRQRGGEHRQALARLLHPAEEGDGRARRACPIHVGRGGGARRTGRRRRRWG